MEEEKRELALKNKQDKEKLLQEEEKTMTSSKAKGAASNKKVKQYDAV